MARRSLDNLLKFACRKWKVRCQLHPDGYIGTDKSDPGLTIVVIPFQKINNHIQSSSDESEEFFFAHKLPEFRSGSLWVLGNWCR